MFIKNKKTKFNDKSERSGYDKEEMHHTGLRIFKRWILVMEN